MEYLLFKIYGFLVQRSERKQTPAKNLKSNEITIIIFILD